ncbi:CDP-alcohol phosphatidyltransferase family protein [Gluconacetobacter takamatsuzukensis]|uniref:CDP-alcohol phosphatidyltransferase family protein n=1 Tax=Gluconacetobacter takamatsuzukensis TaxID=1286190 RepID=A0A7W4KAY2_9PROT|nr:CDP-alcohol phosphatidyltransferase family protein [Gluconacetobacter takamatsuzukensis]MBB2203537.1 CDP-alcohol phosphatidyltransferase family protein [Gluconacetobacter takamatsuzukensis]
MQQTDPVRRTSEIEELTNLHVIHPVSGWLTRHFARLGVAPNAVSLGGMAAGVLAGVAYHHVGDPRFAVAGFLLMVVWHVMDGADGQLARLTGKQSQTGKILDGICDYVTFVSVYVGLALALSALYGAWVWALVVLAGMCHAVQSAAYERQRQDYNFWGWQRGSPPMARAKVRSGRRMGDLLFGLYNRLESLTAPGGEAGLNQRLAGLLAAYPDRAPVVRLAYREAFAPLLRGWSILSANYRTIGIFLCVFCQVPLAYFTFEIVGFTAILMLLLARQRVCDAAFASGLDGLAGDPPGGGDRRREQPVFVVEVEAPLVP